MSRIGQNGRFVVSLCIAVVFCLGVYGCAKKNTLNVLPAGKAAGSKTGDVLVTIGTDTVTTEEYKEEIALLPPAYRAMAASNKQQFVDSLINKHLLLEEARKLHLENNANVKKLLEKAKDEIMMQELIGTEISDKVKVTDADIEKHYQFNKEKYMEPAKTRASHILVDSEVVAEKVLADLKQGADFAQEVKEYSLDLPTKNKAGDTDYFAKGTLLPEFEEACDKLAVGETSEVVKTSLGYHIIKVTDKKPPEPRPLEEIKGEIENELFVEKQVSLYDELMKKLKDGKNIKINSAVLEKLSAE